MVRTFETDGFSQERHCRQLLPRMRADNGAQRPKPAHLPYKWRHIPAPKNRTADPDSRKGQQLWKPKHYAALYRKKGKCRPLI